MDKITNLIASGDYAGAIDFVRGSMYLYPNTTKTNARADILLRAASSGVWLLETLQTPEQQNACRVMIESLIQEARRILINNQ